MEERLFFEATLRNRAPIGKVLERFLPSNGSILEIASGSGEHGVTFQKLFPSLVWQTSDPDPNCRKSIRAWIRHQELAKSMPLPLDIDVRKRPWPLNTNLQSSLKAIVCINMVHISYWECTQALFEEAGKHLKNSNLLILYGPFKIGGKHTSNSNESFDKSLKIQDKNWGIRELEDISELGAQHGFNNDAIIEMPANNLSVIFKKRY